VGVEGDEDTFPIDIAGEAIHFANDHLVSFVHAIEGTDGHNGIAKRG
jgi:hypothetical protein